MSLSYSTCSCPLQVLNLSPALATGLILVSCCPGGQVGHCPLFLTHTSTYAVTPFLLSQSLLCCCHVTLQPATFSL